MYKAKVDVCSEIRTKHSTRSEHHVEFLNVNPVIRKETVGLKRLTLGLLMSYIYIYIYIYGAPILDVSRSHTTAHHSR